MLLKSILKHFTILPLLISSPALAASFPDKAFIAEACQFVATPPDTPSREGIRAFTLRQGWLDANNDGEIEQVILEEGGTAHAKNFSLISLLGKKAPEIIEKHKKDSEDSRWVGWNDDVQWLNYKGRIFLIDYADYEGKIPQHLWYIEPDYKASKLCSFKGEKKLLLTYGRREAKAYTWANKLCQSVAEGEINSYLPMTTIESQSFGNETHSREEIVADILNEGTQKKLYLAEYASGRGAGCDYKFFVIDGDQNHIKEKNMIGLSVLSQQFYEAQQLDFSGGGSIGPCGTGNNPRLFTYEGNILLERRNPSDEVGSEGQLLHEVWLFKSGQAINFCRINYTVKTTYSLSEENSQ